MKKYVYSFNEGNKDMRELLGGKGANLCEMTSLGLPVPSGFIVTTEACSKYYKDNEKLSDKIINEIYMHIESLEKKTKKEFGSVTNPLLISVRSGSRVSMPGMMDTILNLGLNDKIVSNYIGNKRFIYDSYRRLIMMYSDVVMGFDRLKFEKIIDKVKIKKNIKYDIDLTEEDMYEIVIKFKDLYKKLSGKNFPQDSYYQLIECIKAVFKSWNNERAKVYRKINNIPDNYGTAVNVQEMVYGNLNENSGTGVAFSRNPSTGENEFYGEYLINAQGEDVVSGARTPSKVSKLKEELPKIYDEFYKYAKKLEKHYKDMQDMEFTIENGKLYMLQTRNGKRTAKASVKIAVDMVKEKLITKKEALLMVDPNSLEQLLHKTFDENDLKNKKVLAKGLPASPGAGVGKIYFNKESLIKAKAKGEKCILVRLETSAEDIEGMKNAEGVITIRGGMTSHAAVVARGMGKCCVCGVDALVDEKKKILKINNKEYSEGSILSVDGINGNIYDGEIKTKDAKIEGEFKEFLSWTDEYKTLKVFANADTKEDAKKALELGAEGIGLCRTEHMFFKNDRIFNFRKMIISQTKEEREKHLKEIIKYQKDDFKALFKEMNGKKIVIRYLDPPLHEFLPKTDEEIKKISDDLGISISNIKERIEKLKEFNPMMGHRGLRLFITYPEIAIMQTTALIEAAISIKKEGINVNPHIMIPLTSTIEEYRYVKNIIKEQIDRLLKKSDITLKYSIGTMIETPRAAIISDKLSKEADFFSYGTNDLTQLTYGYSRDDSPKFLKIYYDKQIMNFDPFKKIDEEGVGMLVKTSSKLAKMANKNIELGICGEHAGDPSSIEFFNKIGLDYISCSVYRLPASKLSAAQIAIKRNTKS